MTINWDDPAERFRLIDQVGLEEYNRLHADYRKKSVVATVHGHDIWPINCRFGRLYHVGGTEKAFGTLKQATDFAAKLSK